MLDGISQSLVNMASKVGKSDLDKGVVFDTQTGKFAVNRNADQMGLGDHNFFQNEVPTELGRQNAIIRSALANSPAEAAKLMNVCNLLRSCVYTG